LPITERVFLGP